MGGVNINSQGDTSIGGDVVGRDKKIEGDNITTGNVGTGAAVALGSGATANVTNVYPAAPPRPGSAPPLPPLIIGRENDLRNLKTRLA